MVPFSAMISKIRDTNVVFSSGLFAANVMIILFALNVVSGTFGFIFELNQHLITILLLLGVVLLNLPVVQTIRHLSKKNPHLMHLSVGVFLCLFGFLLLIVSRTPLLWIVSIPVILCGLSLCLLGIDQRRNELHLLAVTSFGYGLIFLLLDTIPQVWSLFQQSSLVITHAIGMLTRAPLLLGPTTSGQDILLVSLVFLISSFLLAKKRTRRETLWFCICFVSLLIVWLCYLLLLDQITYLSSDALVLHPFLFLFSLLPLFGFLIRSPIKDTITPMLLPKGWVNHSLKKGAVLAAVLLFLSTSLLTVFITGGIAPPAPQKVIFYGEHMIGTWDVPAYGKYGKDAVGMFGLWPITLTTVGYTTEILVENREQFLNATQPPAENITRYMNLTDYTTVQEIHTLTTSTLKDATSFVVSNLNISFTVEEQAIIWDYVQKGGSLLVIGDHTNVGGLQEPLNDLLSPVGIRYRFDAALPCDEKFKWLTCTQLLHHPLTAPVVSIDELQYGVGASLELSASSFPIIVGTAVLSDNGNRSNADIAYLGDYEYNKGEQLGDVILVAGAYYGDGKVLVFGDTSSFQNPAFPYSEEFVQSSFAWLASKQTGTTWTFQIGLSLLLLIGAFLAYWFFRKTAISFAWFPFLLCVSLLMTSALNPLVLPSMKTSKGNIVYIDASHNERFSLESFTDDSLNGLFVSLERNNLQPFLLREFSKEKIMKSRLLICNAPTAAFTTDEVVFLRSYMEQGGVVLIATGYEDKDAFQSLLSTFEMDVEPTPLGPVPYVEENLTLYQNEPRFVDSWPISFQSNQTTSFYNFTWGDQTFHLVVFVRHGEGGLLLISDSQFLLDKNLESIYDYWPGNILFIKYLLDELPMQGAKR